MSAVLRGDTIVNQSWSHYCSIQDGGDKLFKNSNSGESEDEDPVNSIAEAKRQGASLSSPEKAKISRERKLQTNPAFNLDN